MEWPAFPSLPGACTTSSSSYVVLASKMSGYRTLHRHRDRDRDREDDGDGDANAPLSSMPSGRPSPPVWRAKFSPCCRPSAPAHHARTSDGPAPQLRLLASCADGTIRAYQLSDKATSAGSTLDASAVKMEQTDVLLGRDQQECECASAGGIKGAQPLALGYAALDIERNYGGSDPYAGDEVVVGVELDGTTRVWVKEEQALALQVTSPLVDSDSAPEDDNRVPAKPHVMRAAVEFKVSGATGSTCAIRRVGLGPIHGTHPKNKLRPSITVAMGCLDGSVAIIATGIPLHVRSVDGKGGGRGRNESFAAPVVEAGTVHDRLGTGSAVPTSLSWSPLADNLAVGRKDGTVDLYNFGQDDGAYRRLHRILCHSKPVRGLAFTSDAALLITGDDDGNITLHDVVQTNPTTPVRLVGAVISASLSYILDLAPLPDGKRFVSCGADGLVKVWDVRTLNSGPSHTFADGKGTGIVWSVTSSSDGRRLASAHDNGMLVIYSSEE